MNERILELAIEARKYAESKPDIYQVAYDKKFAELIVRECVDVVSDGPKGAHPRHYGLMIEIHFGVEE